jgi:hypothetical protein
VEVCRTGDLGRKPGRRSGRIAERRHRREDAGDDEARAGKADRDRHARGPEPADQHSTNAHSQAQDEDADDEEGRDLEPGPLAEAQVADLEPDRVVAAPDGTFEKEDDDKPEGSDGAAPQQGVGRDTGQWFSASVIRRHRAHRDASKGVRQRPARGFAGLGGIGRRQDRASVGRPMAPRAADPTFGAMATCQALGEGRDHTMTGSQSHDRRRFRLAGNDNETLVADDGDQDTEAHRLATNDNETVVDGLRRLEPDTDGTEDDPAPMGARRLLRR